MHALKIYRNEDITAIEGAWKISQNRDDKNYKNIISELEKLNDINSAMITGEMKKLDNGQI